MSLLNGFQSLGGSLGTLAGNMLADEQAKLLRPKPLLESASTYEPRMPPTGTDDPSASTQPPSGASVGGKGGGVALGMRQNNPGNLAYAGQPGASPGQGNRFASFPDMPSGVAATAAQLALYQTQHGISTVQDAVTRWVSDPKADLKSYIGNVAAAIGVRPDAKIDLTDPVVQAKFILAQQPHESGGGGAVLNPADVIRGVEMAAAARSRVGATARRTEQPDALLQSGAT